MKIRKEAVAGAFYPYGPTELDALLEALLYQKELPDIPPPKAVIVPHAGYVFSGQTAAVAYRRLSSSDSITKRVVIFGPCHRVPFNGLALSSADKWETPIGEINVDTKTCQELNELEFVNYNDDAHNEEHSIEAQIPFIKKVFNNVEIVPILTCMTSLKEAVAVMEKVWGDEETLIIISADLSHFLDYDACKQKDAETVKAIENLDYSDLDNDNTCGFIPICALIDIARRKKMKVETFDVRNSGDTAGKKDSVVGYASIGFWEII
ncbi:MAG: AmmeMemoRadiSam system protein B [Alphaproteobacteria bacterium]